jgi:hypothetical protein
MANINFDETDAVAGIDPHPDDQKTRWDADLLLQIMLDSGAPQCIICPCQPIRRAT